MSGDKIMFLVMGLGSLAMGVWLIANPGKVRQDKTWPLLTVRVVGALLLAGAAYWFWMFNTH